MSGFYEEKYEIERLSADEVQRIIAGLALMATVDEDNGMSNEAAKSNELIDKINMEVW
jgi:hypothetical protein